MFKQYSILLFLFLGIYSILPDQKRQELLEKLTKKMYNDNDRMIEPKSQDMKFNNLGNNIDYNISQVDEIIKKYDFPKNYNFFKDNDITPNVKNQEQCGGCWSFAATSALAYRFEKKYGIKLDLSPQDGLSCYIGNCFFGNYGIDAQLNLLKNGTLTEQCFHFVSGEDPEYIPKCPSKCEDDSEFKRYYSQNVYSTEDMVYDNREEDFYDFMVIIMDQLITKGPVVTNIDVYDDFQRWNYDINCKYDAYAPKKDAEILSGHAMVIVGYGFLENKNKYYWLIQNSWGTDPCDKGFLKIEFGKSGVEQVTFSEAYFPEKEENKTQIDVYFSGIDEQCNLLIETDSQYYWNNTLEIKFKNEDGKTDIYYYCTNYLFPIGSKAKCFTEILNYNKAKGNYTFDSSKSIGNQEIFNLDKYFKGKNFYYKGWPDVAPYAEVDYQEYFFSSERSKITFWYNPDGVNPIFPRIYSNIENKTPLKKCDKVVLNDYNDGEFFLAVCDIQKEEMEYFNYYDPKDDDFLSLMTFEILCGDRDTTYTYANRINPEKYAIFEITDFYYQRKGIISVKDKLVIHANITGDISYFNKKQSFLSFLRFTKEESTTETYNTLIQCFITVPEKLQTNYEIICNNDLPNEDIKFNEIYLLPYIILYENNFPYEVILKEEIKGKFNNTNNNKDSYIKLHLVYIICLLALIF
jgi:hypothetical protein